jgi:kynurenine formamidase
MVELIDLSGHVEEGQPLAGSADDTRIFTTLTHEERGFQVKKELEEKGIDSETEYVRRHLRAEREGYDEQQPMNRMLLVSEHGPTHVDSIDHLDPTSDLSIDEMSLDWFYGSAICLDLSDVEHPAPITTEDLEAQLDEQGLEIREDEAVLLETGNRRTNYSTTDREKKHRYQSKFVGLEESAGEFLVERGAKSIGIDSISVDHPENIYPNYDFPIHALCSREEIVIYENMANLHEVVGERFTLSAFPLKIKQGTGSPIRPVAILDGGDDA